MVTAEHPTRTARVSAPPRGSYACSCGAVSMAWPRSLETRADASWLRALLHVMAHPRSCLPGLETHPPGGLCGASEATWRSTLQRPRAGDLGNSHITGRQPSSLAILVLSAQGCLLQIRESTQELLCVKKRHLEWFDTNEATIDPLLESYSVYF